MPTNILEQQIINILKQLDHEVNVSDIEHALAKPIPRRTLSRKLSELVKAGQISASGKGRATKYTIADNKPILSFSSEAKDILTQISQPIQLRDPVAYKRNFLYDYQPNETYYLPESARSHLETISQPFNHDLEPGTYVKRILHRLLIDLSWNSSRLEGNTYSLLETERLINFGAIAEGKNAIEAQMILNHKDAIEFMVNYVDELSFNSYFILNLHAFLSNNLLANPMARGQLRQIPVGIGGTVYHPPEIPQLIEKCFQQILDKAEKIQNPFEQAFFAMVHLPYLQPFEDVNKRVSRLAANIPLIKHNLAPLSFTDVPKSDYVSGILGIYELNQVALFRDVFIWAYERSAKQYQLVIETIGEPNLIHIRYKKELQALIHLIITNNLHGNEMLQYIKSWTSEKIPTENQHHFQQIIEREIASLHPGNIAIYHIQPDVFAKWHKV